VLLGDRLEIGSKIVSHAAYMGHWVEPLETQVAALGDCRIVGDSSGCQLLNPVAAEWIWLFRSP
jgi:hypothetical protein